jgi:homogentisate phytyltransferase/homogentisate geranylgeranyltransferase
VNVFIVGINQLEDVEIDRINKPFLPIAAGELAGRGPADRRACAVVPLVLAVTQGWPSSSPSAPAGHRAAYSVPPLRLKRFPRSPSLSITVRAAVVVNLGVWLHFAATFGGGTTSAPAACGR